MNVIERTYQVFQNILTGEVYKRSVSNPHLSTPQVVHVTGPLLTHWGRVTHICVSDLTIIGSSHYLNQYWNIVNLTRRNKLQWNVNWNSYFFIQENACENVVCEKAAILSRPQRVNWKYLICVYVAKTACGQTGRRGWGFHKTTVKYLI